MQRPPRETAEPSAAVELDLARAERPSLHVNVAKEKKEASPVYFPGNMVRYQQRRKRTLRKSTQHATHLLYFQRAQFRKESMQQQCLAVVVTRAFFQELRINKEKVFAVTATLPQNRYDNVLLIA